MSVYMLNDKGAPQFWVDMPWIKATGVDMGDIAYEVLHLPDGGEWWAPCGTPDPCPPEIPHRYYRALPLVVSDHFSQPVTFDSGVRWEPTDYKSIDQTVYLAFAAKPEGKPNSE